MIQVYIFSLVLSAILLVASLLVGDSTIDVIADQETTVDPVSSNEIGQLDGVEPSLRRFVVGTFRSVRFWTLWLSFFGMTGLVLDGLDVVTPTLALFVAVAIGTIVGASANAIVQLFSA